MTAIAKDLVAAGSDTTAAAVTMTILELMRSRGTLLARASAFTSTAGTSPPSAGAVSVSGYTTAFDEAVREAHNANFERMAGLQSVNEELPFLMACVKEALRLHPPAVSACVSALPRPFHLSPY